MTDHQAKIIQAAQKGDMTAFRHLMEEHYGFAHRVAYRVLLNGDDATDAVQEAFIKVWRRIGTFRKDMSFTTWFYRIVSNSALDQLRSRSRFDRAREAASEDGIEHATPLRWAEESDMRAIVRTVLGQLPPVQRLVFALRDVEDLSVETVASITGLSASSVKTNLSYARRTMRTLLDTAFDIRGTEQ